MDFTIPNIPRTGFKSGLEGITNFVNACESTSDNTINMCWDDNLSFLKPHIILPLAAYISHLRGRGKIVNLEEPNSFRLKSYFKTINFSEGLSTTDYQFSKRIKAHSHKSYIPLLKFRKSQMKDELNRALSTLNEIIEKKFHLDRKTFGGVSFIISEMTDNILDHSTAAEGWIFGQCYSDGTIYICIADNGIGIRQTYINSNKAVESDEDALRLAITGKSTKEDRTDERGYGIGSSQKITEKGLDGEFILISGHSVLRRGKISSAKNYWKGTIVAMKLTKNSNFDIMEFVSS